jgi:hypothetical protein
MRTARFLLLIVYVAGHAGLPLPLPAGACVAGACGCGDACQCAQEKVAAGNCCCSAGVPRTSTTSCCAAPSGSGCCAHSDASEKSDPASQAGTETVTSESAAAAQSGGCCKGEKANERCDDDRPRPPVLRSCGCQQEAPEGIAACSDPRVLPEPLGPPRTRAGDRFCHSGGPTAPLLVQAPDDPVPRLSA